MLHVADAGDTTNMWCHSPRDSVSPLTLTVTDSVSPLTVKASGGGYLSATARSSSEKINFHLS